MQSDPQRGFTSARCRAGASCLPGRGWPTGAFSVPELLVAVAIVAVLAVFLFGVYGSVSESSRSAECVAKLRQLAIGVRLWRNDHQDRFPPSLTHRAIRTSQYLYESGHVLLPDQWLCPSASTRSKGAWEHIPYDRSPRYRVVFGGKFSSYTVNGLAFYPANLPGMGISYTQSFQMFRDVESQVPIFLDGNWWQLNAAGWALSRSKAFAFRHRDRANVVFLDGHVEAVTREEADRLKPLGTDRRYY